MSGRSSSILLVLVFAVGACGDLDGPVRTKGRAVMIAKRQLGTLAFKGRRVDVSREGDLWVVRLDPDLRDKSKVYASVEIDAATGEVTGGKHDIYQVEIVKP